MTGNAFSLGIKLDDAALAALGSFELSRLLHLVAARIERGETDGKIKDINGNTVGIFEITSKEPWEMTRREYEAAYGKPNDRTTLTDAWNPHKEAVAAEINRGNKNIPAAVLAEYPELAGKEA